MSKNYSNIANDFIDPTVLEFKRFVSQKDAQLLWAARSAARRQAIEDEQKSEPDNELRLPKPGVDNTWTVMPILDEKEVEEIKREWDKRAINTAWLVKKAKQRLVWERRLNIAGFVGLAIMIVIIPIMINSAKESSKIKKCNRNMRDIVFSLEDYLIDNERLPESVDDLAYIVGYESLSEFGVRKSSYSCPSDKGREPSYAVNPDIAGRAWHELDDRTVILVDSNSYVFENLKSLDYRHKNSSFSDLYALAIYKDGTFGEYQKPKGQKINKLKEEKSKSPEAMSAARYNQCLKEQQLCNRNCVVHKAGSQENMDCTNQCWSTFNRCTQPDK